MGSSQIYCCFLQLNGPECVILPFFLKKNKALNQKI